MVDTVLVEEAPERRGSHFAAGEFSANQRSAAQMGSSTGLYGAERWILALIRHLPPHRVSPELLPVH